MRVSGIHLLTGLVLAMAALWVLVGGFPVGVAPGPPVELPAATSGVPVADDAIQIAVSADGGCAVSWPSDGEPTRVLSVTELGRVIGASLRDQPMTPVVLRIDSDTPWTTVSVVIDTLRAHGAGTVWFATEPPLSNRSTI
jgi:biopolymer transport protein TolR